MSAPNFDTNQWYQICLGDGKEQCLIGTSLFNASNTKGAVFMSPNKATATVQRWQIVPVTINHTNTYILRTKDSGPNGFMGTGYSANEESEGMTRPSMFRGDVVDNNVYWNFGTWGDGMFYLTNAINGTYHLNKKNNGIMAMSNVIAAPQNGQRFGFEAVAKIDDEKYSSVNVGSVAPACKDCDIDTCIVNRSIFDIAEQQFSSDRRFRYIDAYVGYIVLHFSHHIS